MVREHPLDFDTADRGITGIGTLIIFIALVLAAALAAGVVLDTTGLLQSQATQTGQDSTKQVSNQLQILSVTGDVAENTEDDDISTEVQQLNIKVFKSPGADDIDLNEATIQYVSDTSDVTLNDGNFSVTELKDNDDSLEDSILNSQTDRAQFEIDLTGDDALTPLAPGDSVSLTLTAQSGAQTVYIVSVPDTLYHGSQDVVEL